MTDLCLHSSCKGHQAILRVIGPGPDEYRPGWWYMFCPRCGMRGPAADNQQDARVLWAAIWAARVAPADALREAYNKSVDESWDRPAPADGLREAINKRVNEFYGLGASAFSIDSRELAAKQCIADIVEIANDAALREGAKEGTGWY